MFIQCPACGQNLGELIIAYKFLCFIKNAQELENSDIQLTNVNSLVGTLTPNNDILTGLNIHLDCSRNFMLTQFDPMDPFTQFVSITPNTQM